MANSNTATFTGTTAPGGGIHGTINFGSSPSSIERRQFQYFEGYKKSFKQMTGLGSGMSAIKNAFSSLFNALFDVIFAPLFPEIIKWIQLFVKFINLVREKGLLGAISDMGFWSEVWGLAKTQLGAAWKALSDVWSKNILPKLTPYWEKFKKKAIDAFDYLKSHVGGCFKTAFWAALPFFIAAGFVLQHPVAAALALGAVAIGKSIWDGIVGLTKSFQDGLRDLAAGILVIAPMIAGAIKDAILGALGPVGRAASGAGNWVSNEWHGITGWASHPFG